MDVPHAFQRLLRATILPLAACCCMPALAGGAQAPAPPANLAAGTLIEHGVFRLHKFAQPIGEESYEIRRQQRSFELSSQFEFTDRGTAVSLAARLKYGPDLTPEQFEAKGSNARDAHFDDAVVVAAHGIHVRRNQSSSDEPRPRRFFTMSGYAPTALQMMLFRYWQAHGHPERLRIFPAGTVQIEHRGSDRVEVGQKQVSLERYIVSGLIWGREAVWLDARRQLVALVSIDAEFDHFEALREGYEAALPVLLASAGRDEMAALAHIARGFPGRRAGKLALIGGLLVDGTGREAIPDSVVVIDGDRITSAGPRTQVAIPPDTQAIDVTGKTILPGLWDMHAHFEQVEWGPIYLAAGATTVRDCGNEFDFITAVRDAIRDGRGLGPRILLAGLVDGTGPESLGTQRVDDPEQARAWVSRYHDAGFQQMKIYGSMTPANVAAVATAAHQLGMSVTGHVPNGMTLVQAIEAGMDQVNHLGYVIGAMLPEADAEDRTRDKALRRLAGLDVTSARATAVVEFLRAHSVVVDPTIALWELGTVAPDRPYAGFEPGVGRLAPELAALYVTPAEADPDQALIMEALHRELQAIGALHAAGIPIVAGTDQAVPGFSLYRELELYVEAGFTPMEAIQSATLVPARTMGQEASLGTVEAGKKADLIVLGANPLDEIRNIRTVEKVVSNGILYDSAPLWQSVGFKP